MRRHLAPIGLASSCGVGTSRLQRLSLHVGARPRHPLLSASFDESWQAYGGGLLSQGTVTDGLRKITPLFEPVMDALRERQIGEKLFHGDETHWDVFAEMEGKVGHRWYLWLTRSASVVFYHIAPSRGAVVPKAHYAGLHTDLVQVVLVCDRYSAYKSLAKDHDEIVLAYCWAHVRQDFLNAARSWPELAPWMWK
jgi:transposase